MRFSRCAGVLFAVTASLAGVAARAEHGSPRYVSVLDEHAVTPKNTLVPLAGTNGVVYGFRSLNRAKPRLTSVAGPVPLRVVDSYDDLEGHARPFDSDDTGYGENLLLFGPTKPLRSGTRYEFVLDGPDRRPLPLFSFTVSADVDRTPPRWTSAPFLAPRPDDPVLRTLVTAIDQTGTLPHFVIVELEPAEPSARRKRMIAALGRADASDRACDSVAVHDHAGGVYADDSDRDVGRRYLARLTALDLAGNRRAAPGTGVPLAWTGSLTICNRPGQAAPPPPPPITWKARPHLGSGADTYEDKVSQKLTLATDAKAPVVVEISLARNDARRTRLRLVSLLGPSDCAAAYVTNEGRVRRERKPGTRAWASVTLIDMLGRRVPQPGPALSLDPRTNEFEVCLR